MLKVKLSKDIITIRKDIILLNCYREGRIDFNKLRDMLSANNHVFIDDEDVKKLIALGYQRHDKL